MNTVFYLVKEDYCDIDDKSSFETYWNMKADNFGLLAELAAKDYLDGSGGDMADPKRWPVTFMLFANKNDLEPLAEAEVSMNYKPVFTANLA